MPMNYHYPPFPAEFVFLPVNQQKHKYRTYFQNPCEASVRSRIFLFFTCEYVGLSVCTGKKRYRPEIPYTHSPEPYLQTSFCSF